VPVFLEACEAASLKIRKKETRPFAAGPIKQSIDIFEIVKRAR
jgi:hypothetical protein